MSAIDTLRTAPRNSTIPAGVRARPAPVRRILARECAGETAAAAAHNPGRLQRFVAWLAELSFALAVLAALVLVGLELAELVLEGAMFAASSAVAYLEGLGQQILQSTGIGHYVGR